MKDDNKSTQTSRSIGRVKALQGLYAVEFQDPNQMPELGEIVDLKGELFSIELISKFLQHRLQVDGLITQVLTNWDLNRVNLVDRNILRLGVLELILKTADKAVVINEYVEIAKQYGTEKSSAFVNGVLDSVKV